MPTHVVVVDRPGDLARHVPAWTALIPELLEPNVFYEPWMLGPALEHLRRVGEVQIVLFYEDRTEQQLLGVFPITRHARYRGLPIAGGQLWKYPHCYLSTPHVHRARAAEVLGAFLDWAAGQRLPLFEFINLVSDGKFRKVLVDLAHERGLESVMTRSMTRPLFRRSSDATAYLRRSVSGSNLKELRRKERRLGEFAPLAYQPLQPTDALPPLLEEFLAVEASGWKRREGSALACNEGDRRFFETVMTEAFGRDRLYMGTLRFDGRAIAIDTAIRTGEGAYAFKLAFDETMGRFSPGALLTLHTIRRLHELDGFEWLDTCSARDSPMARYFTDRVGIDSLLVATGQRSAPVVAAMPLIRWAIRSLRALRPAQDRP
jgi:CelD/BcsL family acetyltransferase involved in cellulose biosynthesis